MKHVGLLALLVSIALGGWSAVSYVQNQNLRQQNAAAMQREVNRELSGATAASGPFDLDRRLHNFVRLDEVLFVAAGCIFIVGIELLWHNRRSARTAALTERRL